MSLEERIAEREAKGLPTDQLRERLKNESDRPRKPSRKPGLPRPKGLSAEDIARRQAIDVGIEYPEDLPVSAHRETVLKSLRSCPVLVLTGETGSGKTTQIPKMLLEAGYGRRGRIAITQPRRLAALAVAQRLRDECRVDEAAIAHAVRFDDRTGDDTLLSIMTDGLLLAEASRDRDLSRYDCIVVDEAHERSCTIDVLLGLLRELRTRRPELAVVITSATIDADRFAEFFADPDGNPAPRVDVPGRLFPVEVTYLDPGDEDLGYLTRTVRAVQDLHEVEDAGDVLVFLPTERDILEARKRLQDLSGATILPCFSRLNAAEQQAIFKPCRGRKIVLATNIAETSLTVPGIKFVVDAGMARSKRFAVSSRTERLPVEPVSQASLKQRAGRAGRLGPGFCWRMMSQQDAESREAFTEPEIRRSNLAGVMLQLLVSGLGDGSTFPWLDAPTPGAWEGARQVLEDLGAIYREDGQVRLTAMGRRLQRIPADPAIARMLLAGAENGVPKEVATVAAFCSLQDPRLRPPGEEHKADQAHAAFRHQAGDLATALRLWQAWADEPSNNSRAKFCKKNLISWRRMREWADVRHQFVQLLKEDSRRGQGLPRGAQRFEDVDLDAVHTSLVTGMPWNVFVYDKEKRHYQGTGNRQAVIHPSSVLRPKRREEKKSTSEEKVSAPPWLLACDVVETSRLFARTVAPIDPEVLVKVLGDRIKRDHRHPRFDEDAQRCVCDEYVSWRGLPIRKGAVVGFARIDPQAASSVFCLALAMGQVQTRHKVIKDNRKAIGEWRRLAEAHRDRMLVPEDEAMAQAYFRALFARTDRDPVALPVASRRDLDSWVRKHGHRALELGERDLMPGVDFVGLRQDYPKNIANDGLRLSITYRHRPGEDDDGASIRIRQQDLHRLSPASIDKAVPGFLKQLVAECLRQLPKDYRRRLQPLAQSAAVLAQSVMERPEDIATALVQVIDEQFGFTPERFDLRRCPPWMRLRLEILGEEGQVIATARGAEALQGRGDPLQGLRGQYETAPSSEWPGPCLQQIPFADSSAWTALTRARSAEAAVCARRSVYLDEDVAKGWHLDGLHALIESRFDAELQDMVGRLDGLNTNKSLGGSSGQIARALMVRDLATMWDPETADEAAFVAGLEAASRRLPDLVDELPRLIRGLHESIAIWQRTERRPSRGFATVALVAAIGADVRRLMAAGWWEDLPLDLIRGLGDTFRTYDAVLKRGKALPGSAESRRQSLLEEWEQQVGRYPQRLPNACGQRMEVIRLRGALEACCHATLVGTRLPQGVSELGLRQGLRRVGDALSAVMDRFQDAEDALLRIRPYLSRASGAMAQMLKQRLDQALGRRLDCSIGADPMAQVRTMGELLQQIRQLLDMS